MCMSKIFKVLTAKGTKIAKTAKYNPVRFESGESLGLVAETPKLGVFTNSQSYHFFIPARSSMKAYSSAVILFLSNLPEAPP